MKWHINPSKLFLHNVLVYKRYSQYEAYYLNGKLHNPNGPAYRSWYENGQLACEQYVLNGRLHNPNGPACIVFNETSTIVRKFYYLKGKSVTKNELDDMLNKSFDFLVSINIKDRT